MSTTPSMGARTVRIRAFTTASSLVTERLSLTRTYAATAKSDPAVISLAILRGFDMGSSFFAAMPPAGDGSGRAPSPRRWFTAWRWGCR